MTIRNLDALLNPSSVAWIGAAGPLSTMGEVAAKNLVYSGFEGPLHIVHPSLGTIEGVKCHPSIGHLPGAPDLAVICAPLECVPPMIAELGGRGVRAAVILPAGRGITPPAGDAELRQAILEAARPYLLRILGPGGLGIMTPAARLNASAAHAQALPGQLALITQSDTVGSAVLDRACSTSIGFSHLVSLGEMLDVDLGDMLDYLANDPQTRAIIVYLERVSHARKFMSAARAAARMKPVIVLKGNRRREERLDARSDAAAMACSDDIYGAAFRRAGMLRVHDLLELFDAVGTLGLASPSMGDRLTIVANGRGAGLLAADALLDEGGHRAELSGETLSRLRSVLSTACSEGNPIDLPHDASPERYADVLKTLLEDRQGPLLFLHSPSATVPAADVARALIAVLRSPSQITRSHAVLTCWLGGGAVAEARALCVENRIPAFDTPASAVRGYMQLIRYQRNQGLLMQTPPSIPSDFATETDKVSQIVERALAEDRRWLTEVEAKTILAAYAIPVVPTYEVSTPEEASRVAAEINGPVALKILSPDITHKCVVGGVSLDLETPDEVLRTAEAMLSCVRKSCPDARILGLTVQPVIRRLLGHELILGMVEDPQFGPAILFGHGGTAVEAIRDTSLGLPPLNMHLAREMMSRTRVFRLLEGEGGAAPADMVGIALTLVKLSQLICDVAEIAEIEINPLLAHSEGVVVLDARMSLRRTAAPALQRLAIRPYPKELEKIVQLPDGGRYLLRPIRPEDEPGLQKLFAALSPDEIRMRFLHHMRTLPRELAARLTQIDYDREMALVLVPAPPAGDGELLGSVRITADPDNQQAEFAILLRGDMTGMGFGPMLMRRIIDLARDRNIRELYGDVLAENQPMLRLCSAFGFTRRRDPDDPSVVAVSLAL
jgi:acetyltransferase